MVESMHNLVNIYVCGVYWLQFGCDVFGLLKSHWLSYRYLAVEVQVLETDQEHMGYSHSIGKM